LGFGAHGVPARIHYKMKLFLKIYPSSLNTKVIKIITIFGPGMNVPTTSTSLLGTKSQRLFLPRVAP